MRRAASLVACVLVTMAALPAPAVADHVACDRIGEIVCVEANLHAALSCDQTGIDEVTCTVDRAWLALGFSPSMLSGEMRYRGSTSLVACTTLGPCIERGAPEEGTCAWGLTETCEQSLVVLDEALVFELPIGECVDVRLELDAWAWAAFPSLEDPRWTATNEAAGWLEESYCVLDNGRG